MRDNPIEPPTSAFTKAELWRVITRCGGPRPKNGSSKSELLAVAQASWWAWRDRLAVALGQHVADALSQGPPVRTVQPTAGKTVVGWDFVHVDGGYGTSSVTRAWSTTHSHGFGEPPPLYGGSQGPRALFASEAEASAGLRHAITLRYVRAMAPWMDTP